MTVNEDKKTAGQLAEAKPARRSRRAKISVASFQALQEQRALEGVQKPKSRRGGFRPGAGRKPGWGEGLTKTLQICVTPEQAEVYQKMGAAKWIRAELELRKSSEPNPAFLEAVDPDFPPEGYMMAKPLASSRMPITMSHKASIKAPPSYGMARNTIDLTSLLVKSAERTFAYVSEDDVLIDLGIRAGDLLIFDKTQQSPKDGQIVLLRAGRKFFLRVCSVADGMTTFAGANAAQPAQTFVSGESDDLSIVGTATFKVAKLP